MEEQQPQTTIYYMGEQQLPSIIITKEGLLKKEQKIKLVNKIAT